MTTFMDTLTINDPSVVSRIEPLCPVFGACGGCAYQDISYPVELSLKEKQLRAFLQSKLKISDEIFEPIVASPQPYHYRNRLDLTLKRSRGNLLFGFQSSETHRMVEIHECPIALKPLSDYLPQLQAEASAKMPSDYLTANLVIRSGEDGKLRWGGIGRRSLCLEEKDYFWTEIEGKKIFYSLETFFQANLGILPRVIQKIRQLAAPDRETVFLDLYSGVGLFGLCFAEETDRVIMIEDCSGSTKLARYNAAYQDLKNVEIHESRVEEKLPLLDFGDSRKVTAMVDPPRKGLSQTAAEVLIKARFLGSLLYLSCHPESLARDLVLFSQAGWKIFKIVPFDFFPRTVHLETLVLLKPGM